MHRAPIDQLLDSVEWIPHHDNVSMEGLPFATHSGVLELFGTQLRCYRLNDGRAIIDADDLNTFFESALDAPNP